MNQKKQMIEAYKSLEEQHVPAGSNERSLNHSIQAKSTSNDARSKMVQAEFMNLESAILQNNFGSLATKPEGDGDATGVYLEKSTTIDCTIVSLDAIKTPAYADKCLLNNNDAMTAIAYSYPFKKNEGHKHDSTQYPRIGKILFSEEIGDRIDAFAPRGIYLPKLDLASPPEGNVGDFEQAFDETHSESMSDFLDYDFDPFSDQTHARIALQVPASLVAFFANYPGSARLHSTPRSAGVGSPTSVLEMPNDSFAVLQQSRM